MGKNIYKMTSKCDVGCDYGSCDKTTTFIFEYSRTVDAGKLFIKRHGSDVYETLCVLDDPAIAALIAVLSGEGETILTPDEINELDKLRQ